MVGYGRRVGGQGDVALPAGEDGGGSVVAVWAGAGLEEGGGGAEGEVGVDAAVGKGVVSCGEEPWFGMVFRLGFDDEATFRGWVGFRRTS